MCAECGYGAVGHLPAGAHRRWPQCRDPASGRVDLAPPAALGELCVLGQLTHPVQPRVADPRLIGQALDLGKVALRQKEIFATLYVRAA